MATEQPRGPFKPESITGLIELARTRKPGEGWKALPVTQKQRDYLLGQGVSEALLAQVDRGGAWLMTEMLIRRSWDNRVAQSYVGRSGLDWYMTSDDPS